MVPFIFFILAWLVWRYEDWANDMFQLTDRDVIDIDRKPFGFGESRKQAPLRNIQNVRAERPGFFATLFDYGYVYVETAGAQSDITFDKIPHPSVVLSDIFRRLDDFREAQRRREGETRRGDSGVKRRTSEWAPGFKSFGRRDPEGSAKNSLSCGNPP